MCTIPFLIIISWYLWGLFLKEILNFIKACDMHYKVSNYLIYVRINIEMWFKYKFDTTTSMILITYIKVHAFYLSLLKYTGIPIFFWKNEFHILVTTQLWFAAIIFMYSFITSQKHRSPIFLWENEFHILYNAANMTTLMN